MKSDRIAGFSFVLQWLLYALLKRLTGSWTRDESVWVFGARGGDAFVDNAKYLFLHVANERPGVRPVWLSKNRRVVRELRQSGYEAYYCYSVRGLLVNLRAGVVVLTQGYRDVAMPCCAGAKTVLLWHGVPLKTISWDAQFPDESAPVRMANERVADEFDGVVVPDDNLADVFESGLHVNRDRMIRTGYPRIDALASDVPGSDIGADGAARERIRRLAENHPVFVYLPTFRGGDEGSPTEQLDCRALGEFLEAEDAYFVVKTHPRDRFDPPNHSRIVRLPGECDIYPILRYADVLVTDYSSVYFDFLALDRPVVFYAYDRDEYEETRGFYFDYDEIAAGSVASTFAELLDALARALEDDPDATARRAVRQRFVNEFDATGDQSAAVYDAIWKQLLRDENT